MTMGELFTGLTCHSLFLLSFLLIYQCFGSTRVWSWALGCYIQVDPLTKPSGPKQPEDAAQKFHNLLLLIDSLGFLWCSSNKNSTNKAWDSLNSTLVLQWKYALLKHSKTSVNPYKQKSFTSDWIPPKCQSTISFA